MTYKGYTGSIEFSENDNLYFGKVQGINSLISYEGSDIQKLHMDFQDAIDDYIGMEEPETVSPELQVDIQESGLIYPKGIDDLLVSKKQDSSFRVTFY